MSFLTDLQKRFSKRDVVMQLIIINVVVFLLVNVYLLIVNSLTAYGPVLQLMGSSSVWGLLEKPWSIITHQFTHENLGHIFFNMLVLYSMGTLLVRMIGQRSILPLYLMGGITGFLFFLFSYNFIPRFMEDAPAEVLGASAAIMAITFAAATYAPRMEVFLFGAFKVELRWIAFALLVLDIVSIRTGVNSGGSIAHMGGAAFGYFYASQLLKGKNMLRWLERFFDKVKSLFEKRKMKVTVNHARPKTDEQFNLDKKARQKKVDIILDKISRSGYDALNKEEKEFLFKHSQK